MAFKAKYGQGQEGRRVRSVAAVNATYLLKVANLADQAVADDASAPMVLDEYEVVSLQLFAGTQGSLNGVAGTTSGSWNIEVSNDYTPGDMGTVLNVGRWVAVPAALISPALVAVVSGASGENQYVQIAPFAGKNLRVSFTRTGGAGAVESYCIGKGA